MAESTSADDLSLEQYQVTSKDKLMIHGSLGPVDFLIKVPMNSAMIELERNNMRMLRQLSTKLSNPAFLPRAFGHGESRRVTYFVEERVPGKPLADLLSMRGRISMLPKVADLLANLNPELVKEGFSSLDGALFEQQVTQPLTKLLPLVPDPGARQALSVYFKDALYGQTVLVGPSHGDFTLSNILAKNGEISGLIDWEAGSLSGLPLLDAVSFLISAETHFSREANLARSVSSLAGGQWEVPEEWDFLKGFYDRFGTDPACHAAIVYLSWLQAMAFRLQGGLSYNPLSIDFFITQVVNTIPAIVTA